MNVFLEIKNIKKHFGEGESRVEVLKGIDRNRKRRVLRASRTVRLRKINASEHYRRH